LYPGVPFYRLAELHEKFRAAGAIPPANYVANYTDLVREIVVPDPRKP
jgi:fatty acid desaturase